MEEVKTKIYLQSINEIGLGSYKSGGGIFHFDTQEELDLAAAIYANNVLLYPAIVEEDINIMMDRAFMFASMFFVRAKVIKK